MTRAAAPAGLAGPCCYGPNVRAATALLACNGHMSIVRREIASGGYATLVTLGYPEVVIGVRRLRYRAVSAG